MNAQSNGRQRPPNARRLPGKGAAPHLLEDPLGVDDEEPPEGYAEGRDEHPVVRRDLLRGVRDERNPAIRSVI